MESHQETNKEITIHPMTQNPTAAWKELAKNQRFIKVTMKPPPGKAPFNKARVVCMSDTHSLTPYIKFDIPDGDIFIHAGDFTKCGQMEEVIEFNNWLAGLPHRHKIVIAGNHELSFDKSFTHPFQNKNHIDRAKHPGLSFIDDLPTLGNAKENIVEAVQTQNIRDILTNCHYLEDEFIEIWGLRIYGTPWQPEFCKWAFNLPRGQACLEKWNQIPESLDILITHTPPIGHGDLCCSGVRAGCVELLTSIQKRIRPKYHIFGHIHEGYGITSDGRHIFVNASTCDINYLPNNPPIVFDVMLPPGQRKED